MMKTIDQAGELKGRRVLMRADFDVPVLNGSFGEPFRIQRQKETLHYLLERGAKVTLASHISAVPSFEPLKLQLEQLLGVMFGDDVILLENTRANTGEKKNDEIFARELAAGCDIYINNAFAVCHRAHASVNAVAKLLPAYAGLLVAEEITRLKQAIDASAEKKAIIMGGAKASTKVPVIKHLIDRSEHILVGGVVANDILKARGQDVGLSLVDEDLSQLFDGLDINDGRISVPDDFVITEGKILDIGPKSSKRFADIISAAKMVIWNGPMGMFEDERYAAGTAAIAQAVSMAPLSIIGGGDTIAAVSKCGIALDRFSFVSTGGGAMLAFLAGERLSGLEALNYYDA